MNKGCKRLTGCFTLLASVLFLCSCVYTGAEEGKFQEPHRPQFHFTPPSQWMNDPNGMVYFDGEYHLFYQHYPDSNIWGPMHWGHAVSTDLVHWEHLPIALYPDSLGYIFSGSAVMDSENTSGFGQAGKPPMVAMFTHHNPDGEQAGRIDFQYQSLAYSTDRGRSWTKYEGNPVIANPGIRDFRDTKVIWDEDSEQWVMVLAAKDHVRIYGSPNLIDWTYLSEFGRQFGVHAGVWECPDLFPIREEKTGEEYWVLLLSINPGGPNGGSATQYFVGDFDGSDFNLQTDFASDVTHKEGEEERAVWLDYGRDNYAGVTWSDIPETDGRRLFIGWMSNWDYAQVVPTKAWRGAMTLPRQLELHQTDAGLRLYAIPVRELDTLRGKTVLGPTGKISESLDLSNQLDVYGPLLEVDLDIAHMEGDELVFGIRLKNRAGDEYRIGYNRSEHAFFSDRRYSGAVAFSELFASGIHWAPRSSGEHGIRMHLFFDASSAECFADGGRTVMTDLFFPAEDYLQMELFVEQGSIEVRKLEVAELQSIWSGRLHDR